MQTCNVKYAFYIKLHELRTNNNDDVAQEKLTIIYHLMRQLLMRINILTFTRLRNNLYEISSGICDDCKNSIYRYLCREINEGCARKRR